MNTFDAITKRRSIRKFKQEIVPRELLEKMVEGARLAPQGANMQPLKYIIVDETSLIEPMFATTKWAGYLKGAGTPVDGEKPTAYVVVLVDQEIKKGDGGLNAGAAVQNMLLVAESEGLGTCWLGAIDRDAIRALLDIPERYIINTIVAVGYPDESPVLEVADGDIKYYKDETGTLHVPKRTFDEIVFHNSAK